MVLVDGKGLPTGVRLESASPSEVNLAEATVAQVRIPRRRGRPRQKPKRIIADRGYDSDPLRERFKKRGILRQPARRFHGQRVRRSTHGRRERSGRTAWSGLVLHATTCDKRSDTPHLSRDGDPSGGRGRAILSGRYCPTPHKCTCTPNSANIAALVASAMSAISVEGAYATLI